MMSFVISAYSRKQRFCYVDNSRRLIEARRALLRREATRLTSNSAFQRGRRRLADADEMQGTCHEKCSVNECSAVVTVVTVVSTRRSDRG